MARRVVLDEVAGEVPRLGLGYLNMTVRTLMLGASVLPPAL